MFKIRFLDSSFFLSSSIFLTVKVFQSEKECRNHPKFYLYLLSVVSAESDFVFTSTSTKLCQTTHNSFLLQASGVKVDAGCKKAYDELHQKHQHSYIIFRISDDDTTIIVDKIGNKNAPYSEFVEVTYIFCKSL